MMTGTNATLLLAGQAYLLLRRHKTKEIADDIISQVELIEYHDEELKYQVHQLLLQQQRTTEFSTLQTRTTILALDRIPYTFDLTKILGYGSNLYKMMRPVGFVPCRAMMKLGLPPLCGNLRGSNSFVVNFVLRRMIMPLMEVSTAFWWTRSAAAMGASSGIYMMHQGVQNRTRKSKLTTMLRKNAYLVDREVQLLSSLLHITVDPSQQEEEYIIIEHVSSPKSQTRRGCWKDHNIVDSRCTTRKKKQHASFLAVLLALAKSLLEIVSFFLFFFMASIVFILLNRH